MSLTQLVQNLRPHGVFEGTTDTAAVAAVASPWWLPYLNGASEISAKLLPVLGVIWLITQIVYKIAGKASTKEDE